MAFSLSLPASAQQQPPTAPPGIGTYRVDLGGLGGTYFDPATGGHVQVMAYGGTSERCKVVGWWGTGALSVNVTCHAATGALADSPFAVFFPRGTGSSGYRRAYLWSNNGTAPAEYQASSRGGQSTVNPNSVGVYTVKFAGQATTGSDGGNVQVTAYGPGSEHCREGIDSRGAAVWARSCRVRREQRPAQIRSPR